MTTLATVVVASFPACGGPTTGAESEPAARAVVISDAVRHDDVALRYAFQPSLCPRDGEYLLAWLSPDGDENDVVVASLSAAGDRTGASLLSATGALQANNPRSPHVSCSGDDCLLLWSEVSESGLIRGALLPSEGKEAGAPFTVVRGDVPSHTYYRVGAPQAAPSGSGFFAAWIRDFVTDMGGSETAVVWGTQLQSGGPGGQLEGLSDPRKRVSRYVLAETPEGPFAVLEAGVPTQLLAIPLQHLPPVEPVEYGTGFLAAVASGPGGAMIAALTYSSSVQEVIAWVADPKSAQPKAGPVRVATGLRNVVDLAVAYDGERFVLVWWIAGTDENGLYGARVTNQGVVVDPEPFLVAAFTPSNQGSQHELRVASVGSGSTLVAYTRATEDGSGVALDVRAIESAKGR